MDGSFAESLVICAFCGARRCRYLTTVFAPAARTAPALLLHCSPLLRLPMPIDTH
jgi:hypothetical protein